MRGACGKTVANETGRAILGGTVDAIMVISGMTSRKWLDPCTWGKIARGIGGGLR